jgi:molybdopterin-guanine dinucleotide biosynthesis protein A
MSGTARLDLAGFVLAGGRSSRMGRDKALLEFGGRPLVALAVERLRYVCSAVSILGDRADLAEYAQVLGDERAGVGPMGGIETALDHSKHSWNLFVPVDMPFLPVALLEKWVSEVLKEEKRGVRASVMSLDGVLQPMPCLLHRELAPPLKAAVTGGQYRILGAVREACGVESIRRKLLPEQVLLEIAVEELAPGEQAETLRRWFVNLNTPAEFEQAWESAQEDNHS